MSVDNTEVPGVANLWDSTTLPWAEALPWYFPTYTRINNTES
jgi:hypothetical protein